MTFTELRGFHGAFATGVASQQGALTLPDTWFRPPFWDLLVLQFLRPNSSNLPCLYSTFHLEYPLVLSRFCIVISQFEFVFWTSFRNPRSARGGAIFSIYVLYYEVITIVSRSLYLNFNATTFLSVYWKSKKTRKKVFWYLWRWTTEAWLCTPFFPTRTV